MNTSKQGPIASVLTGVSHRYRFDTEDALKNVDLTFEVGCTVTLIGPSGAGKSTLLNLLDGRLRGWKGAAVVLDQPLDPKHTPSRRQRAEVGFIFQEFALVERSTVRQNVQNGRLGRTSAFASLVGHFSDDDKRAVQAAMEDAGIEQFAEKRVEQLSGGQRQRVSIARCLAQEPRLILADEPVSNLDPTAAELILELLTETARRRGATLVFSSHQPALATQFADRIIAMNKGSVQFDGKSNELTEGTVLRLYGSGSIERNSLRLVG